MLTFLCTGKSDVCVHIYKTLIIQVAIHMEIYYLNSITILTFNCKSLFFN